MRRLNTTLGAALVGGCLAIGGCGSSPATPTPTPAPATPSLLDTLLAAPTSAVFEGQTLSISAGLNRDFSPSIGLPNPSLLGGRAILLAPDSSAVPDTVTVDAVWAVYGTTIWATTPDPLLHDSTLKTLLVYVRGGPQWPVAAVTQVIVRVTGPSGTQLIRVPNVVITSSS